MLYEQLLSLLKKRKDKEALALMQENPDLCDNNVVRYALDNRCFSCIRFLRENHYITLAGKEERDNARFQDMEDALSEYYTLLKEFSQFLN